MAAPQCGIAPEIFVPPLQPHPPTGRRPTAAGNARRGYTRAASSLLQDKCATLPALLGALPEDILWALVRFLCPQAICRVAETRCSLFAFVHDERVWCSVAARCLWAPVDKALLKLLAAGEARADPLLRGVLRCALGTGAGEDEACPGWRGLFAAHAVAHNILVVDFGSRSTKFGVPPPADKGPFSQEAVPPQLLRLCSLSSTLNRSASASVPPGRQLPAMLQRHIAAGGTHNIVLLGEPFFLLSNAARTEWREVFVRPQTPPGTWCMCVPQPLLALLAHGGPADAVVVNIGEDDTVVVPCLCGEVCYWAGCSQKGLGGSLLTRLLFGLLLDRCELQGAEMMAWCQDLKEMFCGVAPAPIRYDNEAINHLARPVDVWRGSHHLELGAERFLVPEMLFCCDHAGLPCLVLEAVCRAAKAHSGGDRTAVWRRLLGAVVVVGGTAELQGLRARLASELVERVSSASFIEATGLHQPPKVAVLEPTLGLGSPSTAVFHGGQLAAVALCASGLISKLLSPSDQESSGFVSNFPSSDEPPRIAPQASCAKPAQKDPPCMPLTTHKVHGERPSGARTDARPSCSIAAPTLPPLQDRRCGAQFRRRLH